MEKSATDQNGVPLYEDPMRRAKKEFKFWRGIYNKDKNYILGRSPKNWGKFSFHFHLQK